MLVREHGTLLPEPALAGFQPRNPARPQRHPSRLAPASSALRASARRCSRLPGSCALTVPASASSRLSRAWASGLNTTPSMRANPSPMSPIQTSRPAARSRRRRTHRRPQPPRSCPRGPPAGRGQRRPTPHLRGQLGSHHQGSQSSTMPRFMGASRHIAAGALPSAWVANIVDSPAGNQRRYPRVRRDTGETHGPGRRLTNSRRAPVIGSSNSMRCASSRSGALKSSGGTSMMLGYNGSPSIGTPSAAMCTRS